MSIHHPMAPLMAPVVVSFWDWGGCQEAPGGANGTRPRVGFRVGGTGTPRCVGRIGFDIKHPTWGLRHCAIIYSRACWRNLEKTPRK